MKRLFALTILALACSNEPAVESRIDSAADEPEVSGVDRTVAADTATSPGSPGGTKLVPETTAGATALVAAEDNSIGIETELSAGPTVFTITNTGRTPHRIVFEGNEISVGLEAPLAPGQSQTLSVDLKPGTYRVYCDVMNHAENGESKTVTVK